MRSQMTGGMNTIENPLLFRQTENYSLSQHWVIPYILSIQRERFAPWWNANGAWQICCKHFCDCPTHLHLVWLYPRQPHSEEWNWFSIVEISATHICCVNTPNGWFYTWCFSASSGSSRKCKSFLYISHSLWVHSSFGSKTTVCETSLKVNRGP